MRAAREITLWVILAIAMYGTHVWWLAWMQSDDRSALGLWHVLEADWRFISSFIAMLSLNIYWLVRWIYLRFRYQRTGGLAGYAGREFGRGRLPVEVISPDGKRHIRAF